MTEKAGHIEDGRKNHNLMIISLFEKWNISKENFPKLRWTKLGKSIVLRSDWEKVLLNETDSRLKEISEIFNTPIIAIKGTSKGRERRPQTKIVYGPKQKVFHKENELFYVIDLEKTMFSSGNISERIRIGKISAKGETIIDFFAGIGYYSIPLLVHGKAEMVHAIDLSKDALECLDEAGKINQISERLTLHHGDISEITPYLTIKANRIVMGLLPSGLFALNLALDCLHQEGGILHLHDTIEVLKEELLATKIKQASKKIMNIFSKNEIWKGEIIHVEKVKWWATRRKHVVYDIKISRKLNPIRHF